MGAVFLFNIGQYQNVIGADGAAIAEQFSGVALHQAFVGHVGMTSFSSDAKAQGAVNYTDYKLGLGYDLGSGFSVEGAYIGATKKADWGDANKGRVVFTLSKSL